jgi:hypothetical protein
MTIRSSVAYAHQLTAAQSAASFSVSTDQKGEVSSMSGAAIKRKSESRSTAGPFYLVMRISMQMASAAPTPSVTRK